MHFYKTQRLTLRNMENQTCDDNQNENMCLQNEELEALGAIYGDDFQLEDECPATFSITVRVGSQDKYECNLTVTFPSNYPLSAPPIYQLSIPWLRGEEKNTVCLSLQELYLQHIGESIVYLWVEKLREMLLEKEGKEDIPDQLDIDKISLRQFEDENSVTKESSSEDLKTIPALQTTVKINIITGDSFTDRKSTFQAHIATVTEAPQIKYVLSELYKNKKIASATHNMYAYRIFKEDSQNWLQDCDDDGETHAGSRLLHLLQILECKNVIVVVTRWYGGIQLHGDRFKHINNVARQLLNAQGLIRQNISKSLNTQKNKQ